MEPNRRAKPILGRYCRTRSVGRSQDGVLRQRLTGRRGQALAEYGLLMWLFTLLGAATLVTFIFAFEEGMIGYYEDIVNVICLPVP